MNSETREQRLAGIRERFNAWIYPSRRPEWWQTADYSSQWVDLLVAFADSESERVLLEAAKAVCDMCSDLVHWRPAEKDEFGDWIHRGKQVNAVEIKCVAAAIHDLRSKGEGR